MLNKYMNRLNRFLERAKEAHGDNFDYSKVEYVNMHTDVIITCPIHGDFNQIPNNHVMGKQCKQCSLVEYKKKRQWNTGEFIKRSKEVHGDKYDYSKVDYNGQTTKVIIGCPVHGDFEQLPINHLRYECNKCGNTKISQSGTFTKEEFIIRAREVHGDKYDYSKVDYQGMLNKVIITCPIHGDFEQTPSNHTHVLKYDCYKCSSGSSRAEKKVLEFLKNHYQGAILENDRTIIAPLELDIVLPELKIAIEYCGLYWHSNIWKDKSYHLDKLKACNEMGYRLITIFEDEWIHKQPIVESKILSIIGVSYQPKIGARECVIKDVPVKDKTIFLNTYHIQGAHQSTLAYGLYDKHNELVSVLTMKKKGKVYELSRFASAKNVIGAFSKLLNHFKCNNEWDDIYTFADMRWSSEISNVYDTNGFKLEHKSQPNYFYIKKDVRISRVTYQKHKLNGILENFNKALTEHQNMSNNGYKWIYDCGNLKYSLTK